MRSLIHPASGRRQPGLTDDWESKRFATTSLDGWIRRAEASGIRILQQTATTLEAHRSGRLVYYDVNISSHRRGRHRLYNF